eukprot:10083911-Ditylum_brightwellii.AAC.1
MVPPDQHKGISGLGKAHQDTKYPRKNLAPEAALNCSVDADASHYMAFDHNPSNSPSDLLSATATLKVENITVTNKLKEVLRDAVSCTDIYHYMKTKTGWTTQLMDHVRWSALEAAFKTLTLGNKVQ